VSWPALALHNSAIEVESIGPQRPQALTQLDPRTQRLQTSVSGVTGTGSSQDEVLYITSTALTAAQSPAESIDAHFYKRMKA